MVRMLEAHGVKHIFGLCGDTTLPFYDALYRTAGDLTHVLTRDERHAAYMADAYARVTGRVGVCEGPSGGGATYIAPGVVEASESSIPLLAITSDISVSSRGRYTLTELDQEAMFGPLTKFTQVIDNAADLPRILRRAFKEMTTGRPGAAHPLPAGWSRSLVGRRGARLCPGGPGARRAGLVCRWRTGRPQCAGRAGLGAAGTGLLCRYGR